MSIANVLEKIKGRGTELERSDIFTVLIIILASVASFGLGRLSYIEESREPISIVQEYGTGQLAAEPADVQSQATAAVVESQSQSSSQNQTGTQGLYVASKNGKKYFFSWCSGAKSISPANLISFSSKEEAEKAGYTPAANCKGL